MVYVDLGAVGVGAADIISNFVAAVMVAAVVVAAVGRSQYHPTGSHTPLVRESRGLGQGTGAEGSTKSILLGTSAGEI